mmetsp:Transcript_19639/g.40634  ORF Transcript_19639/g.40634 Transcript_19639/m.40634 type:complete len:426 (-) Transcript_19639:85-1362(-)
MEQHCCWPRWFLAIATFLGQTGGNAGMSEPELDVMYLKYKEQPIDTTPVFNPNDVMYNATLDYKMHFFAVQATPLGEAIITNIYLCPNLDCLHYQTPRAIIDFSEKVVLDRGEKTLYKFDVELHGRSRTYTINVNRLHGTETNLRHLIVAGHTVHPKFSPNHHGMYRCFLDVSTELAMLELHLQDQGQTVVAEAEPPVPDDNVTGLDKWRDNSKPEPLRSTPIRRLREEAYGEFQYPNKYLQFPVPMGMKRKIRLMVLSSDGNHRGYYSMDLARQGCVEGLPLFDVRTRSCVRFCDVGYWPDYQAHRCKRCPDLCVSCVSAQKCVLCPKPTTEEQYKLNSEGRCVPHTRPFWQHSERALSMALATIATLIFCCGLLAFRFTPSGRRRRAEPNEDPGDMALADFSAFKHSAPSGYRKLPVEDDTGF